MLLSISSPKSLELILILKITKKYLRLYYFQTYRTRQQIKNNRKDRESCKTTLLVLRNDHAHAFQCK
jgi:hypothetical protein